jgi:hypothetical protein
VSKFKVEHLVLGIMLCAILMFVVAAAVIFLPFSPLSFNRLTAGEQTCPSENVEIYVDYNLNDREFSSIRSMEVQTAWVAEDVPNVDSGRERIVSEVTLNQDQIRPGRTETQGSVTRTAPSEAGVWRLKLKHTVRGAPRIQEVETLAESPTEVFSEDSPDCEGEESIS